MTSTPLSERARSAFRALRRSTGAVQPSTPRPQRRDCQGQLIAAIQAMADQHCQIVDASMRPWWSATFSGAQHRLLLRQCGAQPLSQAQSLIQRLVDAQFSLRGHLVADLDVDSLRPEPDGSATILLAVLTIEDW